MKLSQKEYEKLLKRQARFNLIRANSVNKYQNKLQQRKKTTVLKTISQEEFNQIFKKRSLKVKKQGTNNSFRQLRDELDRVFSLYIRKRDSNICICCGSSYMPQNGHFVSRSNTSVRWDEDNCNCQCRNCNIFKGGNFVVYRQKLIEKIGELKFENLERRSQMRGKSPDKSELSLLINYYQKKI